MQGIAEEFRSDGEDVGELSRAPDSGHENPGELGRYSSNIHKFIDVLVQAIMRFPPGAWNGLL